MSRLLQTSPRSLPAGREAEQPSSLLLSPRHHLVDVVPRVVRELCSGLERLLRGGRRREGKKTEERARRKGPKRPDRSCGEEGSSDAASGCAPASRSSGRPGDYLPWSSPHRAWNVCATGERTSSAARTGCTEQPPGASSAPSPPRRSSAGTEAPPRPLPCFPQALGGLRPPARRRCLDPRVWAPIVTRFVCVWLAGGGGAPNHLHLARRRRPRESPEKRRTGRRAKESNPPGFVCPGRLPRTRIAHGSGPEPPRPHLPARAVEAHGLEKLRRCGGSGCCRARGAPRCGPERGSPHRREQESAGRRVARAPLRARLCAWPAGPPARPASRLLASQLDFPRPD